MSDVKQQQMNRFWDKYIELTSRYNINSEIDRWYVKRIEAYIKANVEQQLVEHTPRK